MPLYRASRPAGPLVLRRSPRRRAGALMARVAVVALLAAVGVADPLVLAGQMSILAVLIVAWGVRG
jgi:hypothetical protein